MHLSMLGRRGGGGGARGRDLMRKYILSVGNLTISTVPGAGVFDKLSFCIYNEQGHSGISRTSGINFATKSRVVSSGKWRGILNTI